MIKTLKVWFANLPKALKILIFVLLAVVVLLVPRIFTSSYIMGIICRILLYCTLAGSLNVINGYTNQFSLGHAGFFAVGCYTTAVLSSNYGWNFWLTLPIAGILTAIIGLLVALPTFRMTGIYLSIVTLGFSEIIRLIALNWTSLTGGPLGIKGIPAPQVLGMHIRRAGDYYYIFLLIAVLFILVTARVLKSRIGRAWMSIREDQQAAQSLGVELVKYKSMNFAYGAFWAGIAGAIYAPYINYVDSNTFTLDEGFNILSMAIIGGMGTLGGPVLGSFVVNILNELLRPVSAYRLVVYGLLIVVMMWIRPQGLIGASDSMLADGRNGMNLLEHLGIKRRKTA
jgi:branched-chain amino acid transport system permease protein